MGRLQLTMWRRIRNSQEYNSPHSSKTDRDLGDAFREQWDVDWEEKGKSPYSFKLTAN